MDLNLAKKICDTAKPFIKAAARKHAETEAQIFYGDDIMDSKEIVKTPVPTGARVMLMKEAAPTESEGGIVIPDNAREKPLTAKVVAVGEKVTTLVKGDEVIYASFAGTVFAIDGQEVIVVDEEDIMLVLREVPSDN